jgi:hypothetical protein
MRVGEWPSAPFVLNVGKHVLLGAARWPGPEMDWKGMSSIGFRWVICACSEDPVYDPFPLKFLARIGLTDLSGGGQPKNPGAESEQIEGIGRPPGGGASIQIQKTKETSIQSTTKRLETFGTDGSDFLMCEIGSEGRGFLYNKGVVVNEAQFLLDKREMVISVLYLYVYV